ncbi:MAG: tetraacyldisaccharide 4'-kinase [Desulfovibrionaceae bacterium]
MRLRLSTPMNDAILRFLQKNLSYFLYPFSLLYALLMWLRRHFYWKYCKSVDTVHIPVIAIGNIAWGGTGKTPVVDYIIEYSLQHSLFPTLISRGYKASPPHTPFLISSQKDSAFIAGDEPLMLAKKYPTIHCIIDPKRNRAAHYALQTLKQDFFLLDDAFQHMSLTKNTTICLLRPEDILEEWNKIIPYGTWREDASAFSYVDAFCMKIAPSHFETLKPFIKKRLQEYPLPLYTFTIEIVSLINFHTGEEFFSLNSEYSLFSAIGNPKSFYESIVTFLQRTPKHHYIQTDHSSFSFTTIQDDILLCTEKDAVKIPHNTNKTIFITTTKIVWGPYNAPYNFDSFLHTILPQKE